jgi:hypothetical protein
MCDYLRSGCFTNRPSKISYKVRNQGANSYTPTILWCSFFASLCGLLAYLRVDYWHEHGACPGGCVVLCSLLTGWVPFFSAEGSHAPFAGFDRCIKPRLAGGYMGRSSFSHQTTRPFFLYHLVCNMALFDRY